MRALRAFGSFIVVLSVATAVHSAQSSSPVDLDALAKSVRDTIRQDYADPRLFTYTEQGREVDISKLGKVTIGPLQTFEFIPKRIGESWKRLVAVDGKPLDPTELARNDAEHAKDLEKEKAETPRQRAARLKEEAEEVRERDAILDDAHAVFEFGYICHETVHGEPMIVVSLTPRPDAKVKTREGGMMKQFAGRLWISEADKHLARVQLHAQDSVSIGWGVVARVEPGSGFDFVRKKVGGSWVASELTVQGSGRTLMFRHFEVKSVTTYSNHQPYTPRSGG